MALQKVADDYFKHLNPLASRIHSDLEDTKKAYEDLWNNLSQDEKEQVLNESIIKPEISIKYHSRSSKVEPKYDVHMDMDDHCSYRDEHSAPFSFRTRSQKNLTIFSDISSKKSADAPIKNKPKSLPKLKSVPHYTPEVDLNDISYIAADHNQDSKLPKTGLDFLDNW